MMRTIHVLIAVVLLLTLVGGLVRILRGPAAADRMLAAQLFGTTGVAVLLVLAEGLALGSLRDVALVFSLLAAVNAIVFVHGGRATPPGAAGAERAVAGSSSDDR